MSSIILRENVFKKLKKKKYNIALIQDHNNNPNGKQWALYYRIHTVLGGVDSMKCCMVLYVSCKQCIYCSEVVSVIID